MGNPQQKLVQDVATQWNSSLHMLERLLEARWPITAVLSDEAVTKRSDCYLDLKTELWELAEEMVKVLQPFAVATTFFSYEENVSLSCVLPVLHGLQEGLKKKKNDNAVVAKFKEVVQEQIQKRWALNDLDETSSLVLASAIDPQFKQLKFLSESDASAVKETLLNRMEAFGEVEGESESKKPRETALDILLGREEDTLHDTSPVGEMDRYFTEPTLPRKESPLTWWKNNATRFPCLSQVAHSLLNIPATSTPSERGFSAAGLIVSPLRACLKPKNVDALVFLNKNL